MSKKYKSIFMFAGIALVLMVALSACSSKPTYPPEMIAEGKGYFEKTCSACHGMDAKGLPNLGKDLTTSSFVTEKSDEELLEFVKTGRPSGDPLNTTGIDMPPKGGNPALSDENINAIIAYLRSIHVEQ